MASTSPAWVCYIEANTVRERLDTVVPGEWDLTLELLPSLASLQDVEGQECAFKARLQVLGVIREDIGVGKDYKQASTDAFKRAAVRFGIGNELYAYEQNWVEMDGDGKYAKPLEDPNTAYARRYGKPGVVGSIPQRPAGVPAAPEQIDPLQSSEVDAHRHGNRVVPEVRRQDVGQPAHEAESEGARLQVSESQLRRRDLATKGGRAWRTSARGGATWRSPRSRARAPDDRVGWLDGR
jgi:hypothetical protein